VALPARLVVPYAGGCQGVGDQARQRRRSAEDAGAAVREIRHVIATTEWARKVDEIFFAVVECCHELSSESYRQHLGKSFRDRIVLSFFINRVHFEKKEPSCVLGECGCNSLALDMGDAGFVFGDRLPT